jgi:poly(A) polymerase
MDAAALKEDEAPSGRLLSYLLRDYLDRIVDWRTDPLESYRTALAECRSFVLPMNPPRIELENAVRLLFRERGVAVKKARTFEKGQRKEGVPERDKDGAKLEKSPADAALDPAQVTAKKRRRRRRRKSGAPSAAEGNLSPADSGKGVGAAD